MRNKQQKNYRLSDETIKCLKFLTKYLKKSETQVLEEAIQLRAHWFMRQIKKPVIREPAKTSATCKDQKYDDEYWKRYQDQLQEIMDIANTPWIKIDI